MKAWPHTALDALATPKEDYQRLVLFLVSKIEKNLGSDLEIDMDEIYQKARTEGDVWDMVQDLLEMKFIGDNDKEENFKPNGYYRRATTAIRGR